MTPAALILASRSFGSPAAVDGATDAALDGAAADGAAADGAADAAGLLDPPVDEQAATRMMAAVARVANRNRPSVKRIDVLLRVAERQLDRGAVDPSATGPRGPSNVADA